MQESLYSAMIWSLDFECRIVFCFISLVQEYRSRHLPSWGVFQPNICLLFFRWVEAPSHEGSYHLNIAQSSHTTHHMMTRTDENTCLPFVFMIKVPDYLHQGWEIFTYDLWKQIGLLREGDWSNENDFFESSFPHQTGTIMMQDINKFDYFYFVDCKYF